MTQQREQESSAGPGRVGRGSPEGVRGATGCGRKRWMDTSGVKPSRLTPNHAALPALLWEADQTFGRLEPEVQGHPVRTARPLSSSQRGLSCTQAQP